MKKSDKGVRLFAVLAIIGLIFSLVAILVFVQKVGGSDKTLEEPAEAFDQRSRENYLILGKDRVSGLTDVMMLVSVDMRDNSVSVVQMPRDTYARYAENGYRKLNGALSALGAQGVCAFLSDNMGVSIDGYFVFGLDILTKVVDAIGGVEIDIPSDMRYRDEYQGLDIALSKGRHLLDGAEAESFVRYRSGYIRGDLGRIDAQKLFMAALVHKVKNELSVSSVMKIATSFIGEIETNVSLPQIARVALCCFETDESDITMVTLAGEELRSSVSGAWFYVLSRSSCERMLCDCTGADSSSFDKNGVFRNATSSEFERIYQSEIAYEVKNSKDISENGIEIAKQ